VKGGGYGVLIIPVLFYNVTCLLQEEISTMGFVEAEVFKQLGLFVVSNTPKISNKCASLDDVVHDA
jgi:hypothetical protein